MTRSELLKRAGEKLGQPVKPHVLDYALSKGYVTPEKRRPDGWNLYGEESLQDFIRYVKERSRTTLSPSV